MAGGCLHQKLTWITSVTSITCHRETRENGFSKMLGIGRGERVGSLSFFGFVAALERGRLCWLRVLPLNFSEGL
ncbi:hypothetical protein B9Z19DRAFT_1086626, partial [Tuber borchii]